MTQSVLERRPRAKGTRAAEAFRWSGSGLHVLEQRELPLRVRYVLCRTASQAASCIRDMSVRGAPAIGCTAAYGMALAAREKSASGPAAFHAHLERSEREFAATRPTAVNLFWSLKRMRDVWRPLLEKGTAPSAVADRLLDEARRIHEDDVQRCRKIGAFGAPLIPQGATVLTHCNAGALATGGYGTALGVVRAAFAVGRLKKVLVDETRPYLQGARLTAWELELEGIPYEIITDNMAAHMMKTEAIGAVVVGADRIAANGDTANKIGTYGLAVLARHHDVPFFVAAPLSTVDAATLDGSRIPIEERSSNEVLNVGRTRIAPAKAKARHPAFDVTPAKLISAIVTDKGVARPPFKTGLARLLSAD